MTHVVDLDGHDLDETSADCAEENELLAREWFEEHKGEMVYTRLYPYSAEQGPTWTIPPRKVKSTSPRIMLDTAVVVLRDKQTFVCYAGDTIDLNGGPDEVHIVHLDEAGNGVRKAVYALSPFVGG